MRYENSILALLVGAALLAAAGCSKQETTPAPTGDNPPAAPPAAAAEPQPPAPAPKAPDAQPAAPAVPAPPAAAATTPAPASAPAAPVSPLATLQQTGADTLRALATDATNRALNALTLTNQAAAMATTQFQALLDQAKSLTANQQYQEALAKVTELYNNKLTPAQKQQVDALKAQIQSAMSAKASSTLGNILGGKK